MSQIILWGTGRAPGAVRVRRDTSDGALRVTSEGEARSATIAPEDVFTYRTTSVDDNRVTSEGDRRLLDLGTEGPSYYALSDVTSDGPDPFDFTYSTNPWQPSAQGGENVFAWAYLTFSWSAAAVIRVTPYCDGVTLSETVFSGTLRIVPTLITLAQQGGALQRISQVFAVPLVRALVRDDVEVTRLNLRGERLQLAIESTGPLGVGELMLEGIEVEFTPVRKAIYAAVDSTGD